MGVRVSIGSVVRPALGRHALHTRILDSDLFEEERDLAFPVVEIRLHSDAGVEVIRDPRLRDGEDDIRHRDGVDEGGPDVAAPSVRQLHRETP
jgi:hypothetical protein